MRYIQKKDEPEFFSEAKKRVNKKCMKPWEDINICSIKEKLRNYIAKEQLGFCAYCECKIKYEYDDEINNGENCDIDHFRKQNIFNKIEDILDYNNLLVSCINNHHCSKYKDKHMDCIEGEGKEKYKSIINPISETDKPNKYFVYRINEGMVKPKPELSNSDKNKAEKTIDLFQLNCKELVFKRKKLFEKIDSVRKSGKECDLYSLVKTFGFYSFIESYLEN